MDKTLEKLKRDFYEAEARYDAVKSAADKVRDKVLSDHVFFNDEDLTRITRHYEDFLMSDEDFEKYVDLCYAEYVKAGIADKRGRDYNPEAVPGELFGKSANQLIDYGISLIPDGTLYKETLIRAKSDARQKARLLEIILSYE